MPNREKVIKGLECCMKWTGEPNTATCHCSDCSYTNMDILGQRCLIDLINDALALLKEQDAQNVVDMRLSKDWFRIASCPRCNELLRWVYHRNYCGYCGQVVKWE